tara:strand:- start:1 stop:237 length:237 start_codon:yes stop_codon:yes gene_type:complete
MVCGWMSHLPIAWMNHLPIAWRDRKVEDVVIRKNIGNVNYLRNVNYLKRKLGVKIKLGVKRKLGVKDVNPEYRLHLDI